MGNQLSHHWLSCYVIGGCHGNSAGHTSGMPWSMCFLTNFEPMLKEKDKSCKTKLLKSYLLCESYEFSVRLNLRNQTT